MFRPAPVQQHVQPLLRPHLEMKLTLRADQKVSFQVFAKHDRAARFALHPQPFRAHTAFLGRGSLIDGFLVAFKPGHVRAIRLFSTQKAPVSSQFLAEPVYPSCTGVSPRASPSLGPPVPPAWGARSSPYKSRGPAPAAPVALPLLPLHPASCS